MGREGTEPELAGQARLGDIRHCIADIGKIQRELGYAPRRDFEEGLAELAAWVAERRLVGVMGGHAAERGTTAFADAALRYQASLQFLESRVRGLMTALTGQ